MPLYYTMFLDILPALYKVLAFILSGNLVKFSHPHYTEEKTLVGEVNNIQGQIK